MISSFDSFSQKQEWYVEEGRELSAVVIQEGGYPDFLLSTWFITLLLVCKNGADRQAFGRAY